MPIQKTKIIDTDLEWKTVRILLWLILSKIAYAIKDRLGGESGCGLFAVFDGHGGK